jgi:hypothetical protein
MECDTPDTLDELRELEREVEREWWWLNGALHAIAQVNSGDPGAYIEMLTQKRAVDRKRVEIACRIAELVGPLSADRHSADGDLPEMSATQGRQLSRRA